MRSDEDREAGLCDCSIPSLADFENIAFSLLRTMAMNHSFVPSICSYCGTGCGIIYQVADGRLAGVAPNRSYPVNEGCLCIKGWNLHEHVLSLNRLVRPLVRTDGQLTPSAWDEAIERAVDGFLRAVTKHGPDSVAMLASAKATNEENYLAQKFMRSVIGTNNIDHCARL